MAFDVPTTLAPRATGVNGIRIVGSEPWRLLSGHLFDRAEPAHALRVVEVDVTRVCLRHPLTGFQAASDTCRPQGRRRLGGQFHARSELLVAQFRREGRQRPPGRDAEVELELHTAARHKDLPRASERGLL